jgi:glutamate-ammonia-ligase adenylyltransferase
MSPDARLPDALRPAFAEARERVGALLSALDDPRLDQEVARSLPAVWVASEFVARQCERDPELVRDIVGSGELMLSYVPGLLGSRVRAAVEGAADDAALMRALRVARNREMVRIAWRDLAGWATLEETLADLSDLAEACIDSALGRLHGWHAARFGQLRDADGRAQQLVVLGMGKLGAHELNFSSDVDLIFGFAAPGESDGERALVAEEYFLRLGQRLVRALDDVTPDGFVARVDLRLRPFGEAGPLAMSAGAMETYYQVHGREWERYALIKARPVAGDRAAGERLLKSLAPFVYRRYLDYGVFESLRDMKQRIESEVARRGSEHDVKLGRGGIREVEFIGQCFQLIRGGRDRRFQERGIERVLALLGETGFLARERADGLRDAYRFLRRVENRLQQWSDAQTHALPGEPLARARLAWSMGFAAWDELAAALDAHRALVQRCFEDTVLAPRAGSRAALRAAGVEGALAADPADPELLARVAALGYPDAPAALAQLARLRDGPAARAAGEAGRRRLAELGPALLAAAAGTARPTVTLERLVTIVETLARRTTYLALLAEMPAALAQLTRLVAASRWIAELVARQPVLLDELIDPRLFLEPPRLARYREELVAALARCEPDDEEAQLDALRDFKQAATLRVAAADVGGQLPLMKVSDHLTEIAECAVRAVLDMAWQQVTARHGVPRLPGGAVAPFAVVAYGKLGGWELGYGSDLDLVFLHDGEQATTDGPRPIDGQAFFMKLGQRIIHLLTTPTLAGVLYEVDTRLRPEGMKGMLVTSLAAFERYQREEAWTWEHQALLRARAVAGDAALGARFARVRREVLSRPRDPAALTAEVVAMRERMRREIARVAPADPEVARWFDLKSDPGGITDLEFLVQHEVLANAAQHPALLDWPDVIRLLEGLVAEGLMPEPVAGQVADAYRALRGRVHAASLQGTPAVAAEHDLADERALVARLWGERFGALSSAPDGVGGI